MDDSGDGIQDEYWIKYDSHKMGTLAAVSALSFMDLKQPVPGKRKRSASGKDRTEIKRRRKQRHQK